MPATAGLVVIQTWQYQGQIEKMTVPMVFSYQLPKNMIGETSNQRFLTVLFVFLHYTASIKTVAALPGLVPSQTWQYQGQNEKMTVPMVSSY